MPIANCLIRSFYGLVLRTRAQGWLDHRGVLFVHVFSHRTTPYRFDRDEKAD